MQKLLAMLVIVVVTFFVTLGGLWIYAASEIEVSISMEQIVARALFGAMLSAWAMILYFLVLRRRPAVMAVQTGKPRGQAAAV